MLLEVYLFIFIIKSLQYIILFIVLFFNYYYFYATKQYSFLLLCNIFLKKFTILHISKINFFYIITMQMYYILYLIN